MFNCCENETQKWLSSNIYVSKMGLAAVRVLMCLIVSSLTRQQGNFLGFVVSVTAELMPCGGHCLLESHSARTQLYIFDGNRYCSSDEMTLDQQFQ